jgi:signal transduction histidine kinase
MPHPSASISSSTTLPLETPPMTGLTQSPSSVQANEVPRLKAELAAARQQLAAQHQQLAQQQEQLAQAQKLTALGELASTTTHEFNNILMTILNYARIGMRHKDEPTRDKALDKINQAAQRAAKITSTVLAVARNRSGAFEPTDLRKLLDDTLVLLEREMQKYRIAVELNLVDVPEVRAVGNQIQQVLVNLLINARQAMPSGGRLMISLGHDAASYLVELTVRDTGTGIPADKLPRIFDSFYTTKSGPDESGRGGTGLGLSACRQIIEAHQGRIRVESTPGRGTAFTIRLPVATRAASSAAPRA